MLLQQCDACKDGTPEVFHKPWFGTFNMLFAGVPVLAVAAGFGGIYAIVEDVWMMVQCITAKDG